MHILLTRQEIYISCCCFFFVAQSRDVPPFYQLTCNDSTLVWKLYIFHLRFLQNAAENMNVWCTLYNLILIATPSAPVVYAPSAFFFIRDLLGSCCSSQTSRFLERGRNNIVVRLRPLSSQSLAAASKAFSKGSLSLCGKLRETAAEEKIFFHRSR